MNRVRIYTDGACSGNPGPGGAGAIIILPEKRKELSKGFKSTTNNRMELTAVILALENVSVDLPIDIFTDSKYISDAFNKGWLQKWINNGWKSADKKPVKNIDLWHRILSLIKNKNITFHWIEGHSGIIENERCDSLAQKALKTPGFKDIGFEANSNPLGL